MILQPGELLQQRYEIIGQVGQGGFGTVYRAIDRRMFNHFVAVKISTPELPPALTQSDQARLQSRLEVARRQFEAEARLLSALHHPRLPRVTDYFIDPERGQFMVMDFIEGDSLADLLAQRGEPLPEGEAVYYAREVGGALSDLHGRTPPIFHRDVKPANVILTLGNQIYLVDFGIAKVDLGGGGHSRSQRGVSSGYSPIEQYTTSPTTARTDLYSLAATLYRLLTYDGADDQRLLDAPSRAAVKIDPLRPPRLWNPTISEQTSEAVVLGMKREAEDRPARVAEWLALLPLLPYAPPQRIESQPSAADFRETTIPHPESVPPDPLPQSRLHPARPRSTLPVMGQMWLGRYQIKRSLPVAEPITRFAAHDAVLRREVAIWLWPRNVADSGAIHKQLMRYATLEHEAIATVLGHGNSDGHAWLTFPELNGPAPAGWPHGKLTLGAAVAVVERLAAALDYAHLRRIFHGPLGSDSVYFDDQARAYLAFIDPLQFIIQFVPELKRHKIVIGEEYHAGLSGAAGDVGALAALLFRLLTGVSPLSAAPEEQAAAHRALPAPLRAIVDRGMAPAEQRYATAGALAAEMRAEQERQAAARRAARQRAAEEKAAQEEAERKRQAALLAAQEKAAREKAAQEKAAREETERKRQAALLAAQEKAAQEKAAQEEAERKRQATLLAAQEKAAREKAAQGKAAQEEAERKRQAVALLAAQEKAERTKVEQERRATRRIILGGIIVVLGLALAGYLLFKALQPWVADAPATGEVTAQADDLAALASRLTATAMSEEYADTATRSSQAGATVTAAQLKSRLVARGDVDVEQRLIPAGSFVMGDSGGEADARPEHTVTLSPFWLDATEVTNEQFVAFVGDTGYKTTAEREGSGTTLVGREWGNVAGASWRRSRGPDVPDNLVGSLPVALVSWEDANAFCAWSGARLPTEAEWEYAARGPDGLNYAWGGAFDGRNLNYCDGNCPFPWGDDAVDDGFALRAPIGTYPQGASWSGALDLQGNVWEWVNDWYSAAYYADSPRQDPTGPAEGELKVLRGGSWYHNGPLLRLMARLRLAPWFRALDVGFRCAQEDATDATPTLAATRSPSPTASLTPPWLLTPDLAAGEGVFPPTALAIIAPENAAQVERLARWGRGVVNDVAYSPDGRLLAVSSAAGVYLYDSATGEEQDAYLTDSPAETIAFAPDGATLAVGLWEETIELRRVDDGLLLDTLLGHENRIIDLAFSPDGDRLASASWDDTVRLWRVSDGEAQVVLDGHTDGASAVAFSPDGALLATGAGDDAIRIWRTADGVRQRTLAGHTDGIRALAFAPDGATLASASADNTIRLWPLALAQEPVVLEDHTRPVLDVQFAPDGQTLASASDDRTVRLWTTADGMLQQTLGDVTDWYVALAYAPDGQTVAAASADGTVHLWQTADGVLSDVIHGFSSRTISVAFTLDGQRLAYGATDNDGWLRALDGAVVTQLNGHTGWPYAIVASPDGRLLASAGRDGDVRLWRPDDGQSVATLSGHSEAVVAVAFSPDGTMVASGGEDTTIRLWDVAGRELIREFTGHSSTISNIVFSPDGVLLASASYDTTVRVLRVADGTLLRTLTGHNDRVNGLAFSPDGATLASGGDNDTIRLWRVADGVLLATLAAHLSDVTAVAFSPDGRLLASASIDNSVRLWDVAKRAVAATLVDYNDRVWGVAFSPDGRLLASASDDGRLRLWGVAPGTPPAATSTPTPTPPRATLPPTRALPVGAGTSRPVSLTAILPQNAAQLEEMARWANRLSAQVAFSPDGATLASASPDGSIKLWRSDDGTLLSTLTGHTDEAVSVVFSPDGATLASGDGNGTVRLWRTTDGQLLRTLTGHTGRLLSVAFAPDGTTLASGAGDNTVRLWRTADGQLVRTLTGHTDWVRSVAFAPDGITLASGADDGTVRLWRATDGQLLRTLTGHTDWVRSVAFAPDGITLASGADDGTVRLWRAADGQLLRTLTGHTDWVRSVAFAPDGITLASGANDGTVRLWGTTDGQLLRTLTLTGHTGSVLRSVAFSPTGATLATAADDGTIRLWGVPAP